MSAPASAGDESWGHASPSASRACTTCGISAPAHDEAIAIGLVRAHAWSDPAAPGTTANEEARS